MHKKPKALSNNQAKTLLLKNPSTTTFKSFKAELAELIKRALRRVREHHAHHLQALSNRALDLSSPPPDSNRASDTLQTKNDLWFLSLPALLLAS